ncbi:MAG: S49 family peptidase, partial [Spongiibacteraceae bacterium]
MSQQKKRGVFSRLLGFLDASRRFTVNVIFLLILMALLFAMFEVRPSMPDGAALIVAPQGVVVDELSTVDIISELAGPSVPAETRLLDLVRAVDLASADERIAMLVLNVDNMTHIGLSKAQELGAAIDRFRATGKAVIASASFYSQDQYLLASYADQIFVNTMGGVALEGFAVYRNYFRSALEKLAINFHVFKVGDFKSALEPIMRDDMSAAARTANEQWLGRLWSLY